MNLYNYVLNNFSPSYPVICINILSRDLKAQIYSLACFPAPMISTGSFSSSIRPAGIKGASSEELSVDGVFRQDVTSKWVWIPLENCFSHLKIPRSHQPQNREKGLIDEDVPTKSCHPPGPRSKDGHAQCCSSEPSSSTKEALALCKSQHNEVVHELDIPSYTTRGNS